MRKNPGRRDRRNAAREAGHGPRAFFGAGLMAAAAAKRRDAMAASPRGLRDENGAYTLVGNTFDAYAGTRRKHMWLAGISAQRGY